MMKMELTTEYSLAFLLSFFCEKLEDRTSQSLVKRFLWSDFYDRVNKITDEEAHTIVTNYLLNTNQIPKNTKDITLTPDLLTAVVKSMLKEFEKSDEYIDLEINAQLRCWESYAYDQKAKLVIPCTTGHHIDAIRELMVNYLNSKYNLNLTGWTSKLEEYNDELDDYYHKNIILVGTYFGSEKTKNVALGMDHY